MIEYLILRKPMSADFLVFVVVPLHDEEDSVVELRRRLEAVFDALDVQAQFILLDDGAAPASGLTSAWPAARSAGGCTAGSSDGCRETSLLLLSSSATMR